MRIFNRAHRTFIDLPLRIKLVLVFAFTMFMVAFVNIRVNALWTISQRVQIVFMHA